MSFCNRKKEVFSGIVSALSYGSFDCFMDERKETFEVLEVEIVTFVPEVITALSDYWAEPLD